MSNLDYNKTRGSRRLLGTIFVSTMVAVMLIVLMVVYPMRRRLDAVESNIEDVDARIEEFRDSLGTIDLVERVGAARSANEAMKAEWRKLIRQTRTYKKNELLADILATPEEGRIDYKVALYDARQWVGYRARNQSVWFPPDLGMEETVGADEVMESKLWQLAANVSLAEMVIDCGIGLVEQVDLFEPSFHDFSIYGDRQMVLYPIKLDMESSYQPFLQFLGKLGNSERFYALQRLMVESMGPRNLEKLKIRAVCTAMLYKNWPGDEDSIGIVDEDATLGTGFEAQSMEVTE